MAFYCADVPLKT